MEKKVKAIHPLDQIKKVFDVYSKKTVKVKPSAFEQIDSFILEYENCIEKCEDFKERALYYIFIDDLKAIKDNLPITDEQKSDLEWFNTSQITGNQ